MTAIATQMIASPVSCAPELSPSAIPDSGIPSAIDVVASAMVRGCRAGRTGFCWAAAIRLSTLASISRPTRSMNDSTTASRYSGPSSRWVSAAALTSSGDSDELTETRYIGNLSRSNRILGQVSSRQTPFPRLSEFYRKPAFFGHGGADLATHRAECSSSRALALTVRDVATADSLRCAERAVAPVCPQAVRR